MLKNKSISALGVSLLCISLLFTSNVFAAEENPKEERLVGEIDAETGRYTSGNKRFRVTLPVRGTRAYVLNAVTDVFTARGTSLSIKPTKTGVTYRLETMHSLNEKDRTASFEQASATAFDFYRRLATRSYRSPLLELSTYNFDLDGKRTIASIYKQLGSDKQGPRFHLFYITDFGNELAFVWTDIPFAAENIEAEEEIIEGRAEQAKKSLAMLRSLRIE